jgi:hypothetical protein
MDLSTRDEEICKISILLSRYIYSDENCLDAARKLDFADFCSLFSSLDQGALEDSALETLGIFLKVAGPA